MYLYIQFVLVYLLNINLVRITCICGGVITNNMTIFTNANYKPKRFLQNPWNPIKIYIDYTDLDSQNLDKSIINNIKEVIEKSCLIIRSLIKVRTVNQKIIIPKCGKLKLISELISNGIMADFFLFPTFNITFPDKNVEAFSYFCAQDNSTGRPLAGVLAFTRIIDTNIANWLEYSTYLAIHEITHLLVFNQQLWSYFKDSNGFPIPLNKTVSNIIVNGIERKIIISPKVIEYAKRHFNCSEIQGVELENQGVLGTVYDHWEARVMLTDYMISESYNEVVISEITLALFEDSGWYQANYYTGGLFRWGKGEGCSFLYNKCISNEKSRFPFEFCDDSQLPICSNGRMSKGVCGLKKTKSKMNSNYNYFKDRIGEMSITDYCPVSVTPNILSAHYFGLNCAIGVGSYPDLIEESISNNSICFISSLVNNNYTEILSYFINKNKAICYKYMCNEDIKTLTVFVGISSVDCPINGGPIELDGYKGILYCPDYNSVCTKTTECFSMIDCVLKKVVSTKDTFTYTYTKNLTIPKGKSILIYYNASDHFNYLSLHLIIMILMYI